MTEPSSEPLAHRCPALCPTCADQRAIAERVLRMVEANGIRDVNAIEVINSLALDAGGEMARTFTARFDEDRKVPF